jgi:hypothetical protein
VAAAIVFAGLLCEGVVGDWAALGSPGGRPSA